MAGISTVAAAIRQAGVVLSQPMVSTTPSSGIAVEHFDDREIGEVAVKRGGGALAGFLDRVHREFHRNAARLVDAVADTLHEVDMCARLQGERSEPVWAMPMIGLWP
jgi:hypothetical protein